MELEIVEKSNVIELQVVEKFNPYHDKRGRFTTASGATLFTYAPGRSKAHDKAIANEKAKHEQALADEKAKRSKVMTNPSGNLIADRKKEWEGADYAVQFKNNTYGRIDLRSKEVDQNGKSWVEGAYGNMKINTLADFGSQIYMIDQKSYQSVMDKANATIKERGIQSRKDAMDILENEFKQQAIRIVDKDYINQQDKARK